MFYLHPWEVDPEQPRISDVGWKRRWRHTVGLRRTESKLRDLLKSIEFDTLSQALEAYEQREALVTIRLPQICEPADRRALRQKTVSTT